jgi:hypothetical protein
VSTVFLYLGIGAMWCGGWPLVAAFAMLCLTVDILRACEGPLPLTMWLLALLTLRRLSRIKL